ncbi:MAG: hypothetical protein GY949_17080 [Gammaproteobacteria bacterium]|nr:hypothetical protein [Gammaproteobacteria bacterium]
MRAAAALFRLRRMSTGVAGLGSNSKPTSVVEEIGGLPDLVTTWSQRGHVVVTTPLCMVLKTT